MNERLGNDEGFLGGFARHGVPPYAVAAVHGGPGAAGDIAPVVRELSAGRGVLEPFQTADTIDGQVDELAGILERHSDLPVILIGHSWGAWLSLITTARHPALVRRLILVCCPPFEERYAPQILWTRLERLNESERIEFKNLLKELNDSSNVDKTVQFARLGELAEKADSFDPFPDLNKTVSLNDRQALIYQNVWNEAEGMRRNGEFLALADEIQCPVAAIHGDHDPHPADGVRTPLSERLKQFEWIQLEKCGHKPWIEKQARDKFFETLRRIVI